MSGPRVPDPYVGPIVPGLDVSVYQQRVDWHRVAATGRVFAIARAAYGLHDDAKFVEHYTGARDAGLVPGSYLYFRPGQDPVAQAKNAADLIGPHMRPGDLPIALDIERSEGMGPHEIEAEVCSCLVQLECDLKVRPMIYAGYFVASSVAMDALGVFHLWTPWYGPSPVHIPKGWQHWTFHQTTSMARIDGVMTPSGKPALVDADEFRGDRTAFDLFRGVVP